MMKASSAAWLMLLSGTWLLHCREPASRYAFASGGEAGTDVSFAGDGGESGSQNRAAGAASGHSGESGGGNAGLATAGESGDAAVSGAAGSAGDGTSAGGGAAAGAGGSQAGSSGGSGEAGLAGQAGSADAAAGGIGGSGDPSAGTGGTAGSNGTQGAPYCEPANFPPVAFPSPSAIAAVRVTPPNDHTQIFATSVELSALGVTWQNTAYDDGSWGPWRCFGVLDLPLRLSTDLLPNGLVELYAVLTNGDLLVTRTYFTTEGWVVWGQWERVQLGLGRASDVATVDGPQLHVYIVDRGSILYRHHLDEPGDDSHTRYSAFYGVPGTDTTAVAAARLSGGRQVVFRATSSSTAIEFAEQTNAALGSAFGAWQALPNLDASAIDLEAVASGSGVQLLVLDSDGRVSKTSLFDADAGEVTRLDGDDETLRFLSVTSRTYDAAEPVFYALGDDGRVYYWDIETWRPIEMN